MNHPNNPDHLRPGSGSYSLMTDLKLNLWIVVAGALFIFGNELLRTHPEWNAGMRIGLTLCPMVAVSLQARSYLKFIRGMDEMQRRLQLEAWLIAALSTLALGTGINILNAKGIELTTFMFPHGLELPGAMLAMVLVWSVSSSLIHRRYE
jgi:hypothetical protein